jgi:hypothetical protein
LSRLRGTGLKPGVNENHRFFGSRFHHRAPQSFNRYQFLKRAKSLVADAADDQQMFGPPERAVLLAVLDYSLSQAMPYSRKRFQFVR